MNVIVFVSHGWNASWLGCYGNEWIATYSLDHLATESVLFDHHFSEWPSIAGATNAWKTGQWCAPQTCINRNLLDELVHRGVQGTLLRDARPENPMGLPGKWNRVIDTNGDSDLLEAVQEGLSTFDQTDRQLLWIETDQLIPTWMVDEELFTEYTMPVEGEEAIEPWPDPPEGPIANDPVLWERLRNSYASAVTLLDQQIGELHAAITALQTPPLLIVTGAWGYALAEHNYVGSRSTTAFEECVHVPLLLRFPRGEQAGRRINALTTQADLLPTLFELFEQSPPEAITGRSLLPLAKGRTDGPHSYIPLRSPADGTLSGLRTPEWACLRMGEQTGLFRKPDDRWEVDDVRRRYLEWSDYLDTHMTEVDKAAKEGAPFPEMLEQATLRGKESVSEPT